MRPLACLTKISVDTACCCGWYSTHLRILLVFVAGARDGAKPSPESCACLPNTKNECLIKGSCIVAHTNDPVTMNSRCTDKEAMSIRGQTIPIFYSKLACQNLGHAMQTTLAARGRSTGSSGACLACMLLVFVLHCCTGCICASYARTFDAFVAHRI